MGILIKRCHEVTAVAEDGKTILSARPCDLESQACHATYRPFPRFVPLKQRPDTRASAPPATSCM
ncbi:hypothetical protein MYA_2768 [Burkholderia sp. KJ006]|nr:hypothetical protein MYA_2768 [Burkholderia sp. KJ006]